MALSRNGVGGVTYVSIRAPVPLQERLAVSKCNVDFLLAMVRFKGEARNCTSCDFEATRAFQEDKRAAAAWS